MKFPKHLTYWINSIPGSSNCALFENTDDLKSGEVFVDIVKYLSSSSDIPHVQECKSGAGKVWAAMCFIGATIGWKSMPVKREPTSGIMNNTNQWQKYVSISNSNNPRT